MFTCASPTTGLLKHLIPLSPDVLFFQPPPNQYVPIAASIHLNGYLPHSYVFSSIHPHHHILPFPILEYPSRPVADMHTTPSSLPSSPVSHQFPPFDPSFFTHSTITSNMTSCPFWPTPTENRWTTKIEFIEIWSHLTVYLSETQHLQSGD